MYIVHVYTALHVYMYVYTCTCISTIKKLENQLVYNIIQRNSQGLYVGSGPQTHNIALRLPGTFSESPLDSYMYMYVYMYVHYSAGAITESMHVHCMMNVFRDP